MNCDWSIWDFSKMSPFFIEILRKSEFSQIKGKLSQFKIEFGYTGIGRIRPRAQYCVGVIYLKKSKNPPKTYSL